MSAPRVKWAATVELSGTYNKETGYGDTPAAALADLEVRIGERIEALRLEAGKTAGKLHELSQAREYLLLDSVPT